MMWTFRDYAPLLAIAALTAAVYWPGLAGPFVFDDFPNIVNNPTLHWDAASWEAASATAEFSRSGPLGRPISYLSFALNYYFGSRAPFEFKLTNLAIHLTNATLVFLLLAKLMERAQHSHRISAESSRRICMLAAALWAVHPINLTSVLYVVQRMMSLSTLFVLLALLTYLHWRSLPRSTASTVGRLTLTAIFWAMGLLSKETAVLLPAYIVLIELLLPDERGGSRRLQHPGMRRPLLLIGITLIIASTAASVVLAPEYFTAYQRRAFSMTERVITESRIVWMYIQMIIFPQPDIFGLFHDDISVSQNLFTPLTTVTAVGGIIALLGGSLYLAKQWPLFAFCILMFLGAHLLESTIYPLELAHEHRNYFAAIWPLLLITLLIERAIARSSRPERMFPLFALLVVGTVGFSASSRAFVWSDPLRLAVIETRNHSTSERAHVFAGGQYAALVSQVGAPDSMILDLQARQHYLQAITLNPNSISAYFGLLRLEAISNGRDPQWLNDFLDAARETRSVDDLVNFGQTLPECAIRNCGLSASKVEALFAAALGNRLLKGVRRSDVMINLARFHSLAGNSTASISWAYRAVENAPSEPLYRLHLATILNHYGQGQAAASALEPLLNNSKDQPLWVNKRVERLIQGSGV